MSSHDLETAKPLFADYPNEQSEPACSIDKFCGAWKSEKDAEEIVSEVRNSRLTYNLP